MTPIEQIGKDKLVVPYNRVFIKLEGLLYGEYTEIDGEYNKGPHRIVRAHHYN